MDILSKPENPNQNRFEAKPNYKYLVESKIFYSKEPEAKTKNLNPKRTDSNRLARREPIHTQLKTNIQNYDFMCLFLYFSLLFS